MAAVLTEQPMPPLLLHLLLRSFYAEHLTARRALTQNMKLNTNKRYLTHFIPPSTFPMSAGCSVSFLCLCNEIKNAPGALLGDAHCDNNSGPTGHNTWCIKNRRHPAAALSLSSLTHSLTHSHTHARTHRKHRRISLYSFQTAPFNNIEGRVG